VSRIARLAKFIGVVESSDVVLIKHLEGLHDQSSHGNWADNVAEVVVTPTNGMEKLVLSQLTQYGIDLGIESFDGVPVEELDLNGNGNGAPRIANFTPWLGGSIAERELKSKTAEAIAKSDAMLNVSTQDLLDFNVDAVFFARPVATEDFTKQYVKELQIAITPAQTEYYDDNGDGDLVNGINLVAELDSGEVEVHHWTDVLDYEITDKLGIKDGKATPAEIARAVRMHNSVEKNYVKWAMQGTPQAETMVRNASCSTLVKLWAQTSNDDYPASLAVQEAVKKQFNLSDSSDWPMTDETQSKVTSILSKHGKLLQSYVQATYDLTQDFLAKQGVQEVTVYRGVSDVASLNGSADSVSIFDVQTRPASSWSLSKETARNFAVEFDYSDPLDTKRTVGGVVESVVNASQILGMAGTGMGCFHEFETVLLGKPMIGRVVPWKELNPK